MGFGILLMGFLLSMSNYPGYTDCAAFFIMFYALLKLGVYNKPLRISKYAAFIIMTCGIAGMMLALGEFIGFVDHSNTFINIYDNVSEVMKLIYGFILLWGVLLICIETQLPSLSRLCGWCICINAVSALLFALSLVFPLFIPWRMLVRVVYMLATGYLIFSCYRMICLEGEEDMPVPESRFEIVNQFRRRLDEKAEIGNRKGAEAMEFKRRQAEARQNGVDVNRKLTKSRKKK